MFHVEDLTTLMDGREEFMFDMDDDHRSCFVSVDFQTAWFLDKASQVAWADYYIQEVKGNVHTARATSSTSLPPRTWECQKNPPSAVPMMVSHWGYIAPGYKLVQGIFYMQGGKARISLFMKRSG